MRRLRKTGSILLLMLLSVSAWGDVRTTTEMTRQMREIGLKLMCQCGCGSTVAECNMLYCHGRDPINQDMEEGLTAGLSPDEVLSKLLAKYGAAIRTAPPAEGFGAVGWAMPFVALAAGLLAAPFVVRYWLRKQAVTAGSSVRVDEAAIRKYEQEIERDLEKDA